MHVTHVALWCKEHTCMRNELKVIFVKLADFFFLQVPSFIWTPNVIAIKSLLIFQLKTITISAPLKILTGSSHTAPPPHIYTLYTFVFNPVHVLNLLTLVVYTVYFNLLITFAECVFHYSFWCSCNTVNFTIVGLIKNLCYTQTNVTTL